MSEMNVYTALIAARCEFDALTRDKKGYNYKYADLAQVLDLVKGLWEEHGVWPEILPELPPYPHGVAYRMRAVHAESMTFTEWANIAIPLPEKATPQEYGSALTYARRYLYLAFFGLAQEDDDGAQVSGKGQAPAKRNGTTSKTANLAEPTDKSTEGYYKNWAIQQVGKDMAAELWEVAMGEGDDEKVVRKQYKSMILEAMKGELSW